VNCQVIQLDGLGDSSSEDDNQEDDDDDDENDEANDDTPAEEEVRFVLVFFTNGDSSRVHCQNVDNENVDSHNVEVIMSKCQNIDNGNGESQNGEHCAQYVATVATPVKKKRKKVVIPICVFQHREQSRAESGQSRCAHSFQ